MDQNQKNLSDITNEIEKLRVSSTAEGDLNQENLSDSTSEIKKKLQVSSTTAETDKDLEIQRLRRLLAQRDKFIRKIIDYGLRASTMGTECS